MTQIEGFNEIDPAFPAFDLCDIGLRLAQCGCNIDLTQSSTQASLAQFSA